MAPASRDDMVPARPTNPPLIRPATRVDIPEVAGMLSAMVEDMGRNGGHAVTDPETRARFFAELVQAQLDDPACRHLVATDEDGRPVGAANATVAPLPAAFELDKSLHISAVYVLPDSRRGGIGAALVRSLLDWGRDAGCREADLNVLTGNPAFALYTQLGFTEVQRKLTLEL